MQTNDKELKHISHEIDQLEEYLQDKDSEFLDVATSPEEYHQIRSPFTGKIASLDRRRRILMKPIFESTPDTIGNIMPIKEFIESVKTGMFIDYDGFGYYSRNGVSTNILIHPSDIDHNSVRKDFDEIIWYNK